MNFTRIRILTIFLFMFILYSFLFPLYPQASSRGVVVISDLSHKSGKLGAYRALIIGINDYKDSKIPDLETAVNDARAMAELLRGRYGFQVALLLDRKATKEAIYDALRELALSTEPDDSVLIYYAGHGDLDRAYNDGWWIPADARGGNPVTYLDNVQVQKAMRSMKARHVLLISDSCYSGTLFGQARTMPHVINDKYYIDLYNEKSRWGMTSGNKTPVSDVGTGGHSVFAYQLINVLRKNEKPYISTQEIYTRIAPIVGNNSEQTPLCRPVRDTGDQGGEFVFVVSSTVMNGINAETVKVYTELAAERRRLEHERIEFERLKMEVEQKKLEAERRDFEKKNALEEQRLEAKRKDIKKENKMMASIPRSVISPKVFLRSKGLNIPPIIYERKKYNFFHPYWNKKGNFENDFVDNNDGTVTDRITGLMWQKDGSSKKLSLHKKWDNEVISYIEELNSQRFSGFLDWRLPTTEEFASLLEPKKANQNLYIDPVFVEKPICVSADTYPTSYSVLYCHVNFAEGLFIVTGDDFSGQNKAYVRAVRSIK